MLGPIWLVCRSRRRSSSVFPDSCVVLSAVLMNGSDVTLDEAVRPREVGDEVMWSM